MFILVVIYALCLLFSAGITESASNRILYVNEFKTAYTTTSKLVSRFTIILFSIMTYSYSFSKEQDEYMIIILVRGVGRVKYFMYKIITIQIILGFFIVLLVILNTLVGKVYLNHVFMNINQILSIYLQGVIYGLYSLLILNIVQTTLVSVVIIIIYWINEVIGRNVLLLDLFFPSLNNGQFQFGILYVIMLLALLILLNTYVYTYKEFR